jgi:hypothetical protein
VIITCRREDLPRLQGLAGSVPVREIGVVGGREVVARIGDVEARLDVDRAREAFEGALPAAVRA